MTNKYKRSIQACVITDIFFYIDDFVTVRSCIMNTVSKTQAYTDADTCRLYAGIQCCNT